MAIGGLASAGAFRVDLEPAGRAGALPGETAGLSEGVHLVASPALPDDSYSVLLPHSQVPYTRLTRGVRELDKADLLKVSALTPPKSGR